MTSDWIPSLVKQKSSRTLSSVVRREGAQCAAGAWPDCRTSPRKPVQMALVEVESDEKHFLNSSWHDGSSDTRERQSWPEGCFLTRTSTASEDTIVFIERNVPFETISACLLGSRRSER